MGPRYLFWLLALSVGLSCNSKNGGKTQPPVQPPGESFALSVKAPEEGKVGQELVASVQVVPKGPYKVNMEYPTKLEVKGPATAEPTQESLAKKQAVRHTTSEILFKPAFKLKEAGDYAFEGELRFSVCTKKQCEIKREKVKWVAKVKGE